MISYHPVRGLGAHAYGTGFKTVDSNDVERLAKGISTYVWSPCVWERGDRKETNFRRADWLVLDFDSPGTSLAEAVNLFCDSAHIIGTTKSHQIEKGGIRCDRYRVALRLERSITDLRDYRFTMKQLLSRYPDADQAPKDGARFFFPCTEIVSALNEGYTESPLTAPEWFGKPNLARARGYARCGILPPKSRRHLTEFIPIGERNNAWYGVAKDLTRMGVEPADIAARIVASPTYQGQVTEKLYAEIESCIRNGVNAVSKEE